MTAPLIIAVVLIAALTVVNIVITIYNNKSQNGG